MLNNLRRLLVVAGLLMSGSVLAMALSGQSFTKAEFDQLQQSGKPTLVIVHADWCPVCRAQDPILSDLLQAAPFKGINALVVDFDQQKDILRFFKVSKQSTLIVFKNGKEVGRTIGDTNKDSITELLKKAV